MKNVNRFKETLTPVTEVTPTSFPSSTQMVRF